MTVLDRIKAFFKPKPETKGETKPVEPPETKAEAREKKAGESGSK